MIYVVTGMVLAGGIGAAMMLCPRAAKLKHLARLFNLRYTKQTDRVLSEEPYLKAHFFKRGLHQFFHVLTWQDPGAFICVCEDRVFVSPLDSTATLSCTLATAELTQYSFVPFVLSAQTGERPLPAPNLPEELATRYTLSAPEGYQLPAQVTGYLKSAPQCYLEATAHALIYHEFHTVPVAQVQPLHFRVLQLVQALRIKPEGNPTPAQTVSPNNTPPAATTPAELQAQIMLKLQSAAQQKNQTPGTGRYIYGIVILLVLAFLLFAAWYALHQLAAAR